MSKKILGATIAFLGMYGFLCTGAAMIALDGQPLVAAMFLGCFAPSLLSDYKVFKEIIKFWRA